MTTRSIRQVSDRILPEVLHDRIDMRWQRLVDRDGDAAGRLLSHARLGPSAASVLGISEWIASDLIAKPTLIEQLLTDHESPRTIDSLAADLNQLLANQTEQAQVMRVLRQFRRQEMIRITWRDLAGWADLQEVMTTLSALADVCIRAACDWAHRLMPDNVGLPADIDGERPSLVVLGLGKLGGSELNLSSDIDLIFCYSAEGETTGDRTLSHHEYFIRVGQRFIQLLDTVTEDGFVFRVDMRLRPNGDSGPLVLSFDSMEHYYQTHGRDWERYALVKARALTGSVADCQDIMQRLRPFVYRRYLDYRAFDAIRDMRRMIVAEIRGDVERDVKRGTGGIRQIEFIVQTLQLVRGGRLPELRTTRWREALDTLTAESLLDAEVEHTLTDAYDFLRRVEHRLQAVRDEQTHQLPEEDDALQILAFAMNFTTTDDFNQVLKQHRQSVNERFDQHFATPVESSADQAHGSEVSHSPTGDVHLESFDDPDTIEHLLSEARKGRHYTALTSDARQYLDRLMPLVLNEAINTVAPETTVRRLLDIIQSIGRRTAYFALLVEEPVILKRLCRLVSASSWFSRWLGQYPVLLDSLLNGTAPGSLLDSNEMAHEFKRELARHDPDDLEQAMSTLREFHHARVLDIAAADLDGRLDTTAVGTALTNLATTLIHGCVQVAAHNLQTDSESLAIIGYGRLGSGEMNYSSDLDLVFLFDDTHDTAPGTDAQVAIERSRSRLIRRIIHVMTTRTEAGDVYELDMRLRPNGRSGTLITTLGAFHDYQKTEAWAWEHQALVRARPICGPDSLLERFVDARADILGQRRDRDETRTSIVKMRRTMLEQWRKKQADNTADTNVKLCAGGLVDIEFIVQYLVLTHAHDQPSLLEVGSTPQLLNQLADETLISTPCSTDLINAHHKLMHLSQRQALMESDLVKTTPELNTLLQSTSAHWSALMQDIRE